MGLPLPDRAGSNAYTGRKRTSWKSTAWAMHPTTPWRAGLPIACRCLSLTALSIAQRALPLLECSLSFLFLFVIRVLPLLVCGATSITTYACGQAYTCR
jgi:hypothetical protein|eukprot:COSAG02_NODE_7794_length_2843_cov_1.120262_3_plen_99_part_00